jgi:hypothetical protein
MFTSGFRLGGIDGLERDGLRGLTVRGGVGGGKAAFCRGGDDFDFGEPCSSLAGLGRGLEMIVEIMLDGITSGEVLVGTSFGFESGRGS